MDAATQTASSSEPIGIPNRNGRTNYWSRYKAYPRSLLLMAINAITCCADKLCGLLASHMAAATKQAKKQHPLIIHNPEVPFAGKLCIVLRNWSI